MNKKCKFCNKEFVSINGNDRYCSIECIKKNRKQYFKNKFHRNFNKECLICNKIFLGNKIKKYCSEECKHIAELRRNKISSKKHRENPQNIEKIRKQAREGYYRSKDKISLQRKQFRIIHKEELVLREKLYRKNRMQTDIQYRLRKILRDRIKNVVGHNYRSQETLSLIGCSVEELKQYIEKQFKDNMDWNNYGIKGWHIDHIIPCVKFDLTKLEEQKKCFHYTNLQPLWWYENLQKSDKVK